MMLITKKQIFKKISEMLGETIKKDTIVQCNPDHCYISYSQFVRCYPKYKIRFAYKCYPNTEHTYRVLGAYPHVMEDFWDENQFVVVVESTVNRQIFLMGEHGIIPIGKRFDTEVPKKASKKVIAE
jgi:hypothetical protein